MNESILKSIKKLLGLADEDKSFDPDVILHINTALMIITQEWWNQKPFMITDETATWSDFIGENNIDYEGVKSLVYLRVRLLFDPPTNSFVLQSMNEQIKELEWRMHVFKDNERLNA